MLERVGDLLLIEETIKKFGYDPTELSYGSKKKILHRCDICGEVKEGVYRNLLKGLSLSHRGECAQQKKKQTWLDNYGVDHPSKSEKIKNKIKQVWLDNYGVDNPQKSERIKQRVRQTCLSKYGVDNPRKSVMVKQKIRQTNLSNGNHWTKMRAQKFVESFKYQLLKWGGGVHKKSEYKCPRGDIYMAKFNDFQQGYRCPTCSESKGERQIAQILTDLSLPFIRQYKLQKGNSLKLDFFASTLNLGIEYDGEHHFKPVRFGGTPLKEAKKNFKRQQERDQKKNNWCKELGIDLFRIKYIDNIKQKLEQYLNLC